MINSIPFLALVERRSIIKLISLKVEETFTMNNDVIELAGIEIAPGTHSLITLPSADLYTQTKMGIPIHVFHGKKAGPKIFISSTIHGDETNGIEILRRLHGQHWLKNIKGTLITIPIINVYGFILQSRYLPDRRDLNRSFPGSKSGSLAARLAMLLTEEIFSKCQYGIDLHTGAKERINLPQLRVNLQTPGARQLSKAFDPPVIIDAKIRDGSLRQTASELGIPVLVYEAGEALRFNEICVRIGLRGIENVLNYLGMISIVRRQKRAELKPLITDSVRWVRANISGYIQPIMDFTRTFVVKKGDVIAYIHDPFLVNPSQPVIAPFSGIAIGLTNSMIVNEGDAICNLASTKRLKGIMAYIDDLRDEVTAYD